MPGLIPSSPGLLPGRKGLKPARGCSDGGTGIYSDCTLVSDLLAQYLSVTATIPGPNLSFGCTLNGWGTGVFVLTRAAFNAGIFPASILYLSTTYTLRGGWGINIGAGEKIHLAVYCNNSVGFFYVLGLYGTSSPIFGGGICSAQEGEGDAIPTIDVRSFPYAIADALHAFFPTWDVAVEIP